MGVISYSNVTLSNVNDGVTILSTVVTYAVSISGTIAPTADLTDENGLVLIDADGEHLIDHFEWSDTIPSCPNGWYLWARTVFTYSDGNKGCIYSVSRQGVDGSKGDKGDKGTSVAVVYLYRRSASSPSLPVNDVTYSFSDGTITGDTGSWTQTIPSGFEDLWFTFATATSTTTSDPIPASEWAQPSRFSQNGRGVRSTEVTYGVSNSGTVQPSSWSGTIPTPIKGQWFWTKTVFTYTDTTTFESYTKSYVGTNGYVHVAWATSADGSEGFSTSVSEGKTYIGVYTDENQQGSELYSDYSWSLIRGEDGYNKATINLYKRAESTPSKPSQPVIYTFSTGTLSAVPTGWSLSMPQTNNSGDPCYVISASAVSQNTTYAIAGNNWTDPVKLVEDGCNQAMVTLYKRAETAPSAPTTECVYTFATGNLSPIPTGWSMSIPEANGNPCYLTVAYAIGNGTTYTFGADSWSAPVKTFSDGYSQANVQLYRRSDTVPSRPSEVCTYTFSTGVLSPIPTGWYTTIPAANANRDPCYITMVKFSIQGNIHTIASSDWSLPVEFGADGADGATVNNITQQYTTSTSPTQLPASPVWSNEMPEIDSTATPKEYVWTRWKIDKDNGTTTYTDATCQSSISDILFKVDKDNRNITSKIWQTDIDTSVNAYDNTTVSTLRDRVTSTESNITGITTRVSAVETTTGSLGTRMDSAESEITQNADNISAMVSINGQTSAITLTNNMISAITDQFIIKGSDNSTTVISGGKITANSIKTGDLATNAIRSNGFEAGSGGTYSSTGTFFDLSNGNIHSPNFAVVSGNAYFRGQVTATSGYLGSSSNGFHIDQYGIYSGEKDTSTSGYISLSNTDFQRTINGTQRTLRFAIGSKFGVSADGTLYANGANITNISASNISSGTMSANKISGGSIDATDVTITNLNADNITSGTLSASYIDTSSITLSEIIYNANNRASVTSSGLKIYQGGNEVASFGSNIYLGDNTNATILQISSGSVSIWGGTRGESYNTYYGWEAEISYDQPDSGTYQPYINLKSNFVNTYNKVSSEGVTIFRGNANVSIEPHMIELKDVNSNSVFKVNNQGYVNCKTLNASYLLQTANLSVGDVSWTRTTSVSSGSSSLVTSGAVYTYVNNSLPSTTSSVTSGSSSLVTSGGVYTYVNNKLPSTTTSVTSGSSSLVTSGGVYSAITGLLQPSGLTSSDAVKCYTTSSEAIVMAQNSKSGSIYMHAQNSRTGNRGLYAKNSSGEKQVLTVTSGHVVTLNGTASGGSDLKRKKILEDYDWKIEDFIMGLKPIAYYWRDDNGDYDDRIHLGFGAQDVSKLSKDLGLGDLKVYEARFKDDVFGESTHSGSPYDDDVDDKDLDWYLTYSELAAPAILAIQRLMKRVDQLEKLVSEYAEKNN